MNQEADQSPTIEDLSVEDLSIEDRLTEDELDAVAGGGELSGSKGGGDG